MTSRSFLFIPDCGPCFFVSAQPTKSDLEYVSTGILRIVRLSDLKWMDRDGTWREPLDGIQVEAGIEGSPPEVMHTFPE